MFISNRRYCVVKQNIDLRYINLPVGFSRTQRMYAHVPDFPLTALVATYEWTSRLPFLVLHSASPRVLFMYSVQHTGLRTQKVVQKRSPCSSIDLISRTTVWTSRLFRERSLCDGQAGPVISRRGKSVLVCRPGVAGANRIHAI